MMFILDVYSSFYIVWSCLYCLILNFDIQTVFYKYARYANFPGLIIKLSFNAPENTGPHISENSTHFYLLDLAYLGQNLGRDPVKE